MEELLPSNPMMVASINPTDPAQLTLLNQALSNVAKTVDVPTLQKSLEEMMTSSSDTAKTALFKKLYDAFSSQGAEGTGALKQALIAVGEIPEGVGSETADPQGVMLYSFTNSDKVRPLVEELTKGATPFRNTTDVLYVPLKPSTEVPLVREATGAAPQTVFQIGMIKDVMFIASDEQTAQEIIGRYEGTLKDSLADNKEFKDSISKLPTPFVGYMFYNFKKLIADSNKDSKPEEKVLSEKFFPFPVVGATAMVAQANGISFNSVLAMENDTAFSKAMKEGKATLYKRVPAKQVIVYEEGVGLGGLIQDVLDAAKPDEASLEELKKTVGIGVREDIIPLLNGAVAFVMQNNANSALPGFSFYIDAASHVDIATRLNTTIDLGIDAGLSMAKLSMPSADPTKPLITKRVLSAAVGTGSAVTVYRDRIPELEGSLRSMIQSLLPIEITFVYGLTKDNVLFFSTYDMVEKELADPSTALDKQQLFIQMQNGVTIGKSIVFVNPAELTTLVKKFADLMGAMSPISEEGKQGLALFEKYMGLVKGYFSTTTIDGSEMHQDAFVGL